jgi:two-component system, OmpR family, response regulator
VPCIHLEVRPFTFLKHEGNLVCLRSHVVDVVLVRWPKENEHRDRLAREGRPRLLLLEAGVLPPLVEDPLEDWVRIPAPDTDVRARLDTLALRARLRAPSQPTLDDDGVIRHNGLWASLPPVEARITRLLLDRLGAVVSRESLSRAGWPDGAPGRNALDVHVLRLRRRLAQVGLAIRTVRSRGYLLEPTMRELAKEA